MIELAKKLTLNNSLIEKLRLLSGKELKRIDTCFEKCSRGDFSCLKKESDIIRLAVILKCAVKVKEKYQKAGVSDKIYYDTMSDIKIWCENNGNKGIKEYGWLKNHVSFELFRLGRLQFQLYECKNRTLFYNKLPFSYGEKLVYVHIPQGEKLLKENCLASFTQAKDFFNKYFPDYKYKYYFCESWLLYEGNRDFMDESSNIISFMSLFDIRYSIKYPQQALERIFGKKYFFKSSYPENTKLQKSAKAYMLRGGRLGVGVGVRKADL